MIKMAMGIDDPFEHKLLLIKQCQDPVNITARVNDSRLTGGFTANDITIHFQRASC
jgi:hypothetical protein